MSYGNSKHGVAMYNSYMQMNTGDIAALLAEEGPDALSFTLSGATPVKYANLTYVVNSPSVAITGDVHSEFIRYSNITRVSGEYTYIMDAVPGSGTSGEPVWRIMRLHESGDDMETEWADGDTNFDNAASGCMSISYSF